MVKWAILQTKVIQNVKSIHSYALFIERKRNTDGVAFASLAPMTALALHANTAL